MLGYWSSNRQGPVVRGNDTTVEFVQAGHLDPGDDVVGDGEVISPLDAVNALTSAFHEGVGWGYCR
jgi:hypothetical protein